MCNIKRIYIIFVCNFFIAETAFSQQYWIAQSSPTEKQLYKCFFTDSLYGWAIGDSGVVVHTTNSGVNWNLQQTDIFSFKLEDIHFISRTEGWIVCVDSLFRTIVLKTTNGGQSWAQSYFPDSTMIFSTIYFIDANTGYISGFSGKIFKTTSGGAGWQECTYDTTGCFYLFPKNDIYFLNSQTGFACGGVLDLQGIVMKTTNAGANWNSMCISPEPLNEIIYLNSNKITIMGGDYDLGSNLAVSYNNGANWIYDTTGCFGNATGYDFRTPREVWAALSFTGKFAVNTDSMNPGSRWQCIFAPDGTAVYDVQFKSPTKGWCVGSFGRIYRYNTAVIGIGSTGTNLPAGNFLYQNFPNPFNPNTRFEFQITGARFVSLKIYDLLGREITVLIDEEFKAGTYKAEWNAKDYPSGVYYYALYLNGTLFNSKKMVLLK